MKIVVVDLELLDLRQYNIYLLLVVFVLSARLSKFGLQLLEAVLEFMLILP